MNKVKVFMGAATNEGLKFLEDKINNWIETENIKIIQLSTTYGSKKAEGMGIESTEELFIIVTYEK